MAQGVGALSPMWAPALALADIWGVNQQLMELYIDLDIWIITKVTRNQQAAFEAVRQASLFY